MSASQTSVTMPRSGLDKLRDEKDRFKIESQALVYQNETDAYDASFWDDASEQADR